MRLRLRSCQTSTTSRRVTSSLLTGFGSPAEASTAHAEIAAEIRRRLPPLFDLVTPMPYVALQQMLDEANAWGSHAYEKGTYIADLSDGVIDVLTAHVPRKTSPMSLLLLYRLDGAYSEVDDDATAFSGGRSPRLRRLHRRRRAGRCRAQRRAALGRRPVGGAAPARRRQRRRLRQRHDATTG